MTRRQQAKSSSHIFHDKSGIRMATKATTIVQPSIAGTTSTSGVVSLRLWIHHALKGGAASAPEIKAGGGLDRPRRSLG